MRKTVIGMGIAALLLLLYALAGYWLAPRFLRDALTDQAARRGIELRIERIRTDPFGFRTTLEGIEAIGRDGGRLASAKLASADLAWASLWTRVWRVQRLSVDTPEVLISIGANSSHNWQFAAASKDGGEATPVFIERVEASNGVVQVVDRSRGAASELRVEAIGLEATGLSTAADAVGEYAVTGRLGGGGTLSSRGRVSLEPLAAQGGFEAAGVAAAPLAKFAAPSLKPVRGDVRASGELSYGDGTLVLQKVSLDATHAAYEGIELDALTIESPRIQIPSHAPLEIAARARAPDGARLSAQGSVRLEPFAADVKIDGADISVVRARRWLPETIGPKLASGLVSAKGRLRLDGGRGNYEGALAVRNFRLNERDSGKLLLAWQRLETGQAKLELSPLAIELGEVVASGPQARLIIESGGSVNFAAFRDKKQGAKQNGEALRVALRRLRVENGRLEFADRSLETPFEAIVRDLRGTLTGFSTEEGDPALVALAGRVEKYGSARIRGTINLARPAELADIRASLRNLDLAQLTPYVVKFAGYRVRSGRLSADLRYKVQEGQLVGQNELVFRELQLGEKVQREGLASLPLELVVALFADAEGRINLDIPVRGNLNEPHFDFGGLVARAFANVVSKVTSAPFRALAALFGGEAEALKEVQFAAGSTELSPPEEENLSKVANALTERPQLGVMVRGGYDPERDAAALRAQAVRREVARRAGYETRGPLDFTDPKVLHSAENLWLDRIGNRLELQALRARTQGEQAYGRALIEQLAARAPLDAAAAEKLARTRAEAVRTTLIEQGVDPGRVALHPPASEKAGKDGVPTELTLTAELVAAPAAQGVVAAPAAEGGVVREAQRALNAAGFDAGAADGVLGPRTKRSVREFQEATGLDKTGELDAATLAAMGLERAAAGATR